MGLIQGRSYLDETFTKIIYAVLSISFRTHYPTLVGGLGRSGNKIDVQRNKWNSSQNKDSEGMFEIVLS